MMSTLQITPEDAEVEETKMEECAIDDSYSPLAGDKNISDTSKLGLSTVSKMYDVKNKGKLDPAGLAMRNMDKTGRGFLTNEKVYELMTEHLEMQKSMFQMKKVIIGLLCMVGVLALSNLGTSFASAILAKDTTTNSKSQLVDKKTSNVVATGQAAETFEVLQSNDFLDGRKLQDAIFSTGRFTGVSDVDAAAIKQVIENGASSIKLEHRWKRGQVRTYTVFQAWGSSVIDSKFIALPQDEDTVIYFERDLIDPRFWQLVARKNYTDLPLFFGGGLHEACHEVEDCRSGLYCAKDWTTGTADGNGTPSCQSDAACSHGEICTYACDEPDNKWFCAPDGEHDAQWGCGKCSTEPGMQSPGPTKAPTPPQPKLDVEGQRQHDKFCDHIFST